MGKCKIVCSLDDEESAAKLYGEYTDLGNRIFSHPQYAKPVEEYLIQRATVPVPLPLRSLSPPALGGERSPAWLPLGTRAGWP